MGVTDPHDPTRPAEPGSAPYPYYPTQPYQPAAYPPPIYQPPPPPVPRPVSNVAMTSMVLGIAGVVVGVCLCGIPQVIAVIFGHMGLNQTQDGRLAGRGMAITGLVLGYVFLVPAVVLTLWILSAVVRVYGVPGG
jgi:hypothetical protein